MATLFATLMVISMLLTVGVLAVGMGGFFQGGEFNRKYGNLMMRLRVIMQGVSIMFFVLFLLARG
ncbi:MAG: twin transmembrane helix small protein [Geminicoccaceae bacterium]